MRKIQVYIKRQSSPVEVIHGKVVAETTTHYKVTHDTNDRGEWFAKSSDNVYCKDEQ